MSVEDYEILARLMAALAAGAFIGYERSYHGRPAGFRTHALVCTASSLLMLVTVYESHWMGSVAGRVQIDPTRMAQGIMTGIGFLGAGVIIKEGLSVRGLTTAASIWITAAIGILAGIGFYFPLVVSVAMTLGVLSLFRWIEVRMPSQAYYHFDVRFTRSAAMAERQVRELVESHGFSIANFSYRLEGEGRVRRHSMVIRSVDRSGAGRLSVTLEGMDSVLEFRIAPTGD
jgi:putative Mg2+ transporter-C (MgtC) family protein